MLPRDQLPLRNRTQRRSGPPSPSSWWWGVDDVRRALRSATLRRDHLDRAETPWGSVMLACGMLGIGALAVEQTVAGLCFVGIAAVAFVADRRRTRARKEMERARRDLPALRHQVRKAAAAGENVVALLQGFGYRESKVRDWIVRQSNLRERASVDDRDGNRTTPHEAEP